MNKVIVRAFIISHVMMISSLANAKDSSPIYLQFGTGVSFNSGKQSDIDIFDNNDTKFKNKSSIPFSASMGYRYSPNIRWDVNLTYLPEWDVDLSGKDSFSNNINTKTSISSLSSSINGYYDFTNISDNFIPYVTAGVGFSINKMKDTDVVNNNKYIEKYAGSNRNNFLWKVGLGVTKSLNENVFFDLSYKFVSLGKAGSKTGYGIVSVQDEGGLSNNTKLIGVNEKLEFKNLYSQQIMISVGFNF